MITRNHRMLLSVIVLIVTMTVACMPNSANSAGPEVPGGPVEISEEAARRLEEKVAQAFQAGPSGQFTLRLTDEEVTSWLALRVAPDPENMIAEPQVRFTEGKVYSAMTLIGVLPFHLRIALVALVTLVDGRVEFQIEKISTGPFPVPGFIRDMLSDTVNETLRETQLDVEVTSIEILESEMAIAGRIRGT